MGRTMYVSEKLISALEHFKTDIESVTENINVEEDYLKGAENDIKVVDDFIKKFYDKYLTT